MGEWESTKDSPGNVRSKRYYAKHRERILTERAESLLAHPERREKKREYMRQYLPQWAKRHPDKIREKARKRSYKMEAGEYDNLYREQQGLCAICQQPPAEGKILSVDHDHLTLVRRGLLCDPCNNGLGRFKDSPALLIAAIAYLGKWV